MRVYGTVLGVGFRYAARLAAYTHRVRGHVKNLEDGSVEIECEGREEQIGEFVKAIRSLREPIVVQDIDISYADGPRYADDTGAFKSFRIIPGDPAEEMMEGFDTQTTYLKRMASK